MCKVLPYKISQNDLLKMYDTFWGGVEVACRILRKVNWYFRKRWLSRVLSFVKEQRHRGLSLLFPCIMFTHSGTREKYRRSTQIAEVYCISFKLAKSSLVTYHMDYPYTWAKRIRCKTFKPANELPSGLTKRTSGSRQIKELESEKR